MIFEVTDRKAVEKLQIEAKNRRTVRWTLRQAGRDVAHCRIEEKK